MKPAVDRYTHSICCIVYIFPRWGVNNMHFLSRTYYSLHVTYTPYCAEHLVLQQCNDDPTYLLGLDKCVSANLLQLDHHWRATNWMSSETLTVNVVNILFALYSYSRKYSDTLTFCTFYKVVHLLKMLSNKTGLKSQGELTVCAKVCSPSYSEMPTQARGI